MKDFHCETAYNLDGGGSTEVMIGYKHLNHIYEDSKGRAVTNFIVFTENLCFCM